MPDDTNQPAKEFLVVVVPETAEAGATLRLMGVADTQAKAETLVATLDAGVLGRIAVLERKNLFHRKPAVETQQISDPIAKK